MANFYNALDLHLSELKNFKVQKLSSAPDAAEARMYFNTTTHKLMIHDGTEWVDATCQGIIYSFADGLVEDENHEVVINIATGENAGNVTLTADENGLAANVAEASTSAKGIIEIADADEIAAGTATDKAVTPKQLADGLSAKIGKTDLSIDSASNANLSYNNSTGKFKLETDSLAVENSTKPLESGAAFTALAGKVDALQSGPTAGTYAKVTVNADGLVTEGADLQASDIPNLTLAKITDVTASKDEVNILNGATLTTEELNVLDGITATTTELNYVDGVTSNIQDQLDGKVNALQSGPEAGSYTKVTVNADGLVTEGGSLQASDIPDLSATYVLESKVGAANGVASLDANGLVPADQLPSFVDDVIDLLTVADAAPEHCAKGDKYFNTASKKIFTATAVDTWGATGKDPVTDVIYVAVDTSLAYRYSGTTLVQIGADKLVGFNTTITGDGTTTQFPINHNLGTRNVICEIYDATSYEKVFIDTVHTSTSAVTVKFDSAPSAQESFNIVIVAVSA